MRNLLILLIIGALLAACGPGQEVTILATTTTPSAVSATERPGITVTAIVTANASHLARPFYAHYCQPQPLCLASMTW